MKKVHYVAGVAGLGTVAAAGLMTTATGATAQTANAAASAKTVSLQATKIPACNLLHKDVRNRDIKGGFFYDVTGGGESACIGSVWWSVAYGSRRVCHNLEVTILGRKYAITNVCGSGTVKRKKKIDTVYGAPFSVCLAATRVPGYACGFVPT